ncbi:aldehyde dehydrogenase: dimeric NADP-preferring-like protein, partial [Leptotrombidium deliense]
MEKNIEEIISESRKTFNSGITQCVYFRKDQIRKILQMMEENENEIVEALNLDMKKPSFESKLFEIEYVKNECRGMLWNIDEYMESKSLQKTLILITDKAMLRAEPYGLILIIGTWNYPLLVTLLPLVGAIAAGNAAIIKPSELNPNMAQLLATLIPRYLDKSCYNVINGGSEVTTALLRHKFDYMLFTGSKAVGKIVHAAAAKHFTPITLEMGGKCPVFIDEKLKDLKVSWKRILWGKILNGGQTCVAPDYILCSKLVRDKLLKFTEELMKKFFDGNAKLSDDYTHIVNERHFQRLQNLLNTTKGTIVYGGITDASNLYVSPTIVIDVSIDDPLMNEEIFGPILPIVTVQNESEAIDFINKGPKPLSLYVFSNRKEIVNKFIERTSSGSVCANDVVVHLSADTLPFGGVGESGFGCYHGKYTFDTFSHHKTILVRNFNPFIEWVSSKRYPPYSENHFVRLRRLLRKRRIPFSKYFPQMQLFLFGALT